MPVRSRVFVHQVASPTSGTVVATYTCPAGRTAIVKQIHLGNRFSTAIVLFIGVRRGAVITWIDTAIGIGLDLMYTKTAQYIVLHPGDQLVFYATAGGGSVIPITVYAAGSLLLGEPA